MLAVLSTVQLDGQAVFVAVEIEDVAADRVLAAEFLAEEASAAE